MDYEKYLGSSVTDPNIGDELVEIKSSHGFYEYDYYRPRIGIPNGFLSYEENKADIDKVINRARRSGFRGGIPRDINPEVRKHLEYFRNMLDIYDILIDKKVFSVDEIWWRSLTERADFTEFIKKSRKYSLQAKISMEDEGLPEEYVHPEYTGYDSIIHEAFLPYWEEPVEDYVYSFIPEEGNKDPTPLITAMFEDYNVALEEPIVLWLQPVAGKKSMTEEGSTLLKNTWQLQHPNGGVYFGRRVVVPTFPGSTRDTAIPDVHTLNALKLIGKAARNVAEQLPYSANCSYKTLNSRVTRMKKCSWYLHIDFKKFGLTSPRKAINAAIRAIGLKELEIKSFNLMVNDEMLETTRGSALGWMDPVTNIAVLGILNHLRKKHKWKDMDFIGFNDDIEIGFGEHSEAELLLRKDIILKELISYGFILSSKKIFYSRLMIFLENYFEPRPKFDMRKLQLIVKPYAKSLSTPFAWEAKVYHAVASMKVYNSYVSDICVTSLNGEKLHPNEWGLPLELGGWKYFLDNELQGKRVLNCALEEASAGEMSFYLKMRRYKEPHLCPKKEVVCPEALFRRLELRRIEAYRPDKNQFSWSLEEGEKLLNEEEKASLELQVDPMGNIGDTGLQPKTGGEERFGIG